MKINWTSTLPFTTMNWRYFSGFTSILVMLLFLSCDDSSTNPQQSGREIILTVSPDIGTNQTTFQPLVLIVNGDDTSSINPDYLVQYDYNDDGIAETGWIDSIPHTDTFNQHGRHTLKVIVKDSLGQMDSTSCYIYVQPLVQITPTNTSGSGQENIDWSRDGSNRIAFDTYGGEAGANQSIFIVDYPNGLPEKISFNPDSGNYFFDQFPEWSPLGDRIACASSNGLDIIDVQTHQRTTLDPGGDYAMRSWSPDGRWLCYWAYRNHESKTMIHDFSADTTGVLFDEELFMTWSPDGSQIARRAYRGHTTLLQIIGFPSKAIVAEYEIMIQDWSIDWSPDGRWISVGFNQSSEIAQVLHVESGKIYTIAIDNLIRAWYPSWSEDGTLLAFEARENISGVWSSIWAIEWPEIED